MTAPTSVPSLSSLDIDSLDHLVLRTADLSPSNSLAQVLLSHPLLPFLRFHANIDALGAFASLELFADREHSILLNHTHIPIPPFNSTALFRANYKLTAWYEQAQGICAHHQMLSDAIAASPSMAVRRQATLLTLSYLLLNGQRTPESQYIQDWNRVLAMLQQVHSSWIQVGTALLHWASFLGTPSSPAHFQQYYGTFSIYASSDTHESPLLTASLAPLAVSAAPSDLPWSLHLNSFAATPLPPSVLEQLLTFKTTSAAIRIPTSHLLQLLNDDVQKNLAGLSC